MPGKKPLDEKQQGWVVEQLEHLTEQGYTTAALVEMLQKTSQMIMDEEPGFKCQNFTETKVYRWRTGTCPRRPEYRVIQRLINMTSEDRHKMQRSDSIDFSESELRRGNKRKLLRTPKALRRHRSINKALRSLFNCIKGHYICIYCSGNRQTSGMYFETVKYILKNIDTKNGWISGVYQTTKDVQGNFWPECRLHWHGSARTFSVSHIRRGDHTTATHSLVRTVPWDGDRHALYGMTVRNRMSDLTTIIAMRVIWLPVVPQQLTDYPARMFKKSTDERIWDLLTMYLLSPSDSGIPCVVESRASLKKKISSNISGDPIEHVQIELHDHLNEYLGSSKSLELDHG